MHSCVVCCRAAVVVAPTHTIDQSTGELNKSGPTHHNQHRLHAIGRQAGREGGSEGGRAATPTPVSPHAMSATRAAAAALCAMRSIFTSPPQSPSASSRHQPQQKLSAASGGRMYDAANNKQTTGGGEPQGGEGRGGHTQSAQRAPPDPPVSLPCVNITHGSTLGQKPFFSLACIAACCLMIMVPQEYLVVDIHVQIPSPPPGQTVQNTNKMALCCAVAQGCIHTKHRIGLVTGATCLLHTCVCNRHVLGKRQYTEAHHPLDSI